MNTTIYTLELSDNKTVFYCIAQSKMDKYYIYICGLDVPWAFAVRKKIVLAKLKSECQVKIDCETRKSGLAVLKVRIE